MKRNTGPCMWDDGACSNPGMWSVYGTRVEWPQIDLRHRVCNAHLAAACRQVARSYDRPGMGAFLADVRVRFHSE